MKHDVILSHLRNDKRPVPDKPTLLPKNLLKQTTPIFLIRHPALSIPSFYCRQKAVFKFEADDEDFRALVSKQWVKLVFNMYRVRAQGTAQLGGSEYAERQEMPPVIHAEDIVYNTGQLMARVCGVLDLDPGGIQYAWEPAPLDQQPLDHILHAFFQDVWGSKEVCRDQEVRLASISIHERIFIDATSGC